MTAFRDLQVVIVDTDRTSIRAGLGLHELLKTPSIDIAARVGLRRQQVHDSHTGLSTPDGNGAALNGTISDPAAPPSQSLKVSQYLVGDELDEAVANGEDVEISWPFASGSIQDWIQAEALWRYVLFQKLGLRRIQNESPVLLTVPNSLSRRTHERLTSLFFERFNVAGFSIVERALAQLYAANAVSGVVVDIGQSVTEISPIVDTIVNHSARITVDVGVDDCEIYLAHLLHSNQPVVKAVSPPENPLTPEMLRQTLREIARHIWQEGLVKVPLEGEQLPQTEEGLTDIAAVLVAGKEKSVIESGLKKRMTAKANAAERERAREIEAMDLVQTQWRNLTLTLGKERHRFCEPLFDSVLRARLRGIDGAATLSLQEAVHHAVRRVDIDYRTKVWDGLFVTGTISTPVKGVGISLQSHLAPYIIGSSDVMSDVQPKYIRVLKVPEYFANFREQGDKLASFLGSSIVAKALFSDPGSQTFVSKTEYSKIGPKAIVDFVPTML